MRRSRSSRKKSDLEFPVPRNARQLAFLVLERFRNSDQFVTHLLDAELRRSSLSTEDRRLATELVYGVVRRQRTLEALLRRQLSRPRQQIEPGLWTLLQLGSYQLVFLASIPAHAAVHETVELAKWGKQPRWTGFLNGILRSIERSLTEQTVQEPTAEAVPLTEGIYRRWASPAFADPAENFSGYFPEAFSFPNWLTKRWLSRFDREELIRWGFWFNAPPTVCLRVNVLKSSREEFLKQLETSGIAAHPGERPEAVWLDRSARIEELPGFDAGWFSVQDETAMQAAPLLAPQPGERILDLCAAPGTKTAHLAELMGNRGTIVATDIHPQRLELVERGARRLQLTIIQPQVIAADGSDIPAGPFDGILLDVPCSNTGVLGKRPDARWRIQPLDLEELPQLQRKLLLAACDRIRPGGRVVYSTCSLEPEENRELVDVVLRDRPEMRLIEQRDHLPGKPADGGYQALLQRDNASAATAQAPHRT